MHPYSKSDWKKLKRHCALSSDIKPPTSLGVHGPQGIDKPIMGQSEKRELGKEVQGVEFLGMRSQRTPGVP